MLMKIIPRCLQRYGSGSKKKEVPTPDSILGLAFGFWPSRVLLTAVEVELFTKIGESPSSSLSCTDIRKALGFIDERRTADFLDALVSIDMLDREGVGNDATYRNTPETACFLVKNTDSYVGASLEQCSVEVYRRWVAYTDILTGKKKCRNHTDIVRTFKQDARVKLTKAKTAGKLSAGELKFHPNRIFDVAYRFLSSRILLTAVEMGFFTKLTQEGEMTAKQIRIAFGMTKSKAAEFLQSLTDTEMLLQQKVEGKKTRYVCTQNTSLFLDKSKPTYIGGILEMCSLRLFHFWADLREALETGVMQNEAKETGWQVFPELYSVPARLEIFMEAMIGISAGHFRKFATDFNFSHYKTMVDIGGATGQLASFVAQQNSHMRCITTDLPAVEPVALKWIHQWGVSHRVRFVASNFEDEEFPKGDLITMGMILHDWGLDTKKSLIRKAYNALPVGGALVVLEAIIDDDRRKSTHGLCMSLNMLIEFGADGGFDFTHADFNGWCLEAGFRRTEVMHLLGPSSAAIAYK